MVSVTFFTCIKLFYAIMFLLKAKHLDSSFLCADKLKWSEYFGLSSHLLVCHSHALMLLAVCENVHVHSQKKKCKIVPSGEQLLVITLRVHITTLTY